MFRILYIVSDLRFCGPNKEVFDIIKNLNRDKFEPVVLTISQNPKDSMVKNFQEIGVTVKSLYLSRFMTFLQGKSYFQNALEQIKPDIIHTQNLRPDLLTSKTFYDVPKICTIRGIFPQHYKIDHGRLLGEFMTFLHMNSIRRLDKVIAVSHAVGKNLCETFSLPNVEVIRNGVDTSLYLPVTKSQKMKLRNNLALPESAKVWISSGHLSSRKNPLALILAWRKVFGNSNSNHLVFIGNGPLQESCRQMCMQTQNIHLVGHVKNVADYLNASDYYISASKAEGFPNAVLEAMACGLPVVLSAISPHQEIIQINPAVGKLFGLEGEEELTTAIQVMLDSNYLEASVACIELIRDNLNAHKTSQQYQDIYDGLLVGM
ncbi:MAG: glycosyltransferase family 4 protein [Gloeotrichia echinulata GP01]